MNTDNTRYDGLEPESRNDILAEVSEQERQAARITAYALGQLDAAEAVVVERVLADASEALARRQVAEVQAIAAALQERTVDVGLTRSTKLRQNVLAAISQTELSPRSASRPRIATRGWLVLVSALAALLLIAVSLPSVRPFVPDAKQVARERLVAAAGPAAAPASAMEQADEIVERRQRVLQRTEEKAKREVTGRALLEAEEAPMNFGANGQIAAGAAPGIDALASERLTAPAAAAPVPTAEKSQELMQPGMAGKAVMERVRKAPAWELTDGLSERREPLSGEGYAAISENRPVSPKDQPLSTFSIDVDTASYANVRRFLSSGRLPPPDAVRIEEFVNYFRYDYPQPEDNAAFSVTVDAAECPWSRGHRLVRIGLQGRAVDRGSRPAGNLVFLVDVSGSMQAANKLPLVQQALSMLVEELAENDRVSIVTYAGNAGLVLPPTTGDQKRTIRAAIESLAAGGHMAARGSHSHTSRPNNTSLREGPIA